MHEHMYNNPIKHQNFNILDEEFKILEVDLIIKENLFVKNLKPNLNIKESLQLRV